MKVKNAKYAFLTLHTSLEKMVKKKRIQYTSIP